MRKLRKLAVVTAQAFPGRADMARAVIYGLLSRQHVLVSGSPGNAKSAVATAMIRHLTDAQVFATQFSRGTSDQVVLGPFNLPKLRDEGLMERNTSGYLPTAQIGLLDEVGKAAPVLLHDVLSILNERIFYAGDGHAPTPCPLVTAIATTNESLGEEEANAALYDRFLIRLHVESVSTPTAFRHLLTGSVSTDAADPITMAELEQMQQEVAQVVIPDSLIDSLYELRNTLQTEHNIAVSDRRWRHSVGVIKAAAYMAGNDTATPVNASAALRFTLWSDLEQRSSIDGVLTQVLEPYAAKLVSFTERLTELSSYAEDEPLATLRAAQFILTELKKIDHPQAAPAITQAEALIKQLSERTLGVQS